MLKRKKRAKSALVIALLLAPPVALGVWMLVLFLLDSLQGDGLMQHQYVFESRRQLAQQMLSDGRQALPVFYLAGLLLWLEIHLLARFGTGTVVLAAVIAGALTGVLVAALFLELSPAFLIPSLASALLMSLMIAWAVRPSRLQE